MRANLSDKEFKRKVFMSSLENLIKSSSKIGLEKDRSKNVKDILGWARDIVKRHNYGKM